MSSPRALERSVAAKCTELPMQAASTHLYHKGARTLDTGYPGIPKLASSKVGNANIHLQVLYSFYKLRHFPWKLSSRNTRDGRNTILVYEY